MTPLRVHQAFQQYGLGGGPVDITDFKATPNIGRFYRFLNSSLAKPPFVNDGSVVCMPYNGTPSTFLFGAGNRSNSTRAAFFGVKVGATAAPTWTELWDKSVNPAQTDFADPTFGALLTPGSFGWGGIGTTPQIANLGGDADRIDIPAGIYRVAPTDIGTKPDGATSYILMDTKFNNNAGVRLAMVMSSGELFSIGYTSSGLVAGGFRKQYDSRNILNSVVWDGAKNTGGLMEYGSNANGVFYKYADGRLECYLRRSLVAMTAGVENAFDWTFPAAFITPPPFVSANVNSGSTNAFDILKTSATSIAATTASMRVKVSATQSQDLVYCAVGRWR